MTGQYPLDLPHRADYAAGDFLHASSNAAARALVERWREWPNRAGALWGPTGAGKTHLAHVWAEDAGARVVDGAAFGGLDLGALELGPPDRAVLALDFGVDLPPQEEEPSLFHLLNIVRERRGGLLLVARAAPARWDVLLPDLASRLRALPAAEMAGPDDGLFAAVLAKQLADRQLVVDRLTIEYLARRSERTFEAAGELARRLDRAALARRRRITVQLARDVLADMQTDG